MVQHHYSLIMFYDVFFLSCSHDHVHINAERRLDLVLLMALACCRRTFTVTQLLAGWNVFSSEECAELSSVVRCMSNTTDKAMYDEPVETRRGDTDTMKWHWEIEMLMLIFNWHHICDRTGWGQSSCFNIIFQASLASLCCCYVNIELSFKQGSLVLYLPRQDWSV